jgi:hypothetical protein
LKKQREKETLVRDIGSLGEMKTSRDRDKRGRKENEKKMKTQPDSPPSRHFLCTQLKATQHNPNPNPDPDPI